MIKHISMTLLLLMAACQARLPMSANISGRLNLFGGPYNPSFAAELIEDNHIIVHKYNDGALVSHEISLTESVANEIHVMWREAFYAPAPPAEVGSRQIMDGLKILVSIKENGTLRSGETIRLKSIQSADPHVRSLVERINGLISNERFKLY